PGVVLRFGIDAIDDRQGVDPPTTSLVDTLLQEKRIWVGWGRKIRPHRYRLFPRLHNSHFAGRRGRKLKLRSFQLGCMAARVIPVAIHCLLYRLRSGTDKME